MKDALKIGYRCKVLPHGPKRYVGQLGSIISTSPADVTVRLDSGLHAWFQPSELEVFENVRGIYQTIWTAPKEKAA